MLAYMEMTSGSWFLFFVRTDQTPRGVALPDPTGKSRSQGAQPGELGLQLPASSPWGERRGVAASGSRETGLKGCLSLRVPDSPSRILCSNCVHRKWM